MISGSLKKIGSSYGMTIKNKYIYGEVLGYMMTFVKGSGYRGIYIALPLETEDTRKTEIAEFIEMNKSYYKIKGYRMLNSYIEVGFFSTVGTKGRFVEFIGAITKKMGELKVPSGNICSICSKEDEREVQKVKINNPVLYMHDECRMELSQATENANREFKDEKKNHLLGTIGAIIGGLIGSIPWILVYMFGYFVGWLGFVIGIAANKGYVIFKGKSSKMKPFIIIIVVIICVLTAQFVTECIEVGKYFNSEGYIGYTLKDISLTIVYTFSDVPEYRSSLLLNTLLGLLFAGLGVFRLIKNISSDSKEHEMVLLE